MIQANTVLKAWDKTLTRKWGLSSTGRKERITLRFLNLLETLSSKDYLFIEEIFSPIPCSHSIPIHKFLHV